jgi:hypothetical protein
VKALRKSAVVLFVHADEHAAALGVRQAACGVHDNIDQLPFVFAPSFDFQPLIFEGVGSLRQELRQEVPEKAFVEGRILQIRNRSVS